jgi:hypothetical protein
VPAEPSGGGGGGAGKEFSSSMRRRRRIRFAASLLARDRARDPSLAMYTDALTQLLAARKWRDVLVLHGPLPADAP